MMHDTLADALGMTSQELYAAISDGQTIAELAAAQGVELDDLWLEMPHAEHMKDLGADHAGCGMLEGSHLHHQGMELDEPLLEMPHFEHMKDLGADHVGCGTLEGGHLHHQESHCNDSTYTPTQPEE